jgi:hypothetical protein
MIYYEFPKFQPFIGKRKDKGKPSCIEAPHLFTKTNYHRKVLLGTIYLSHRFANRPFPFIKLLPEVLDVNMNRGGGRLVIFGGLGGHWQWVAHRGLA